MTTLRNWTAKRAGGRITINGVDDGTGNPCKIVGIDLIEPASEGGYYLVATDKDGTKHALHPARK